MLSLPRAQVQSLVREIRSHKPRGVAKKKKKDRITDGNLGEMFHFHKEPQSS